MSDPFLPASSSQSHLPSYSQPLPETFVTSEINRLSTELSKVQRAVANLQLEKTAAANAQRYAFGALILSMLLGLTGVIFGLVVFNRADSAVTQSNQNAAIIQQLKDTQTQLTKSVQGQCSLYSLLIGTYNTKARAGYAQGGPIAYDDAFRRMIATATDLNCGIPTPPDLPR